jgi:hypothetical protein
MRTPLAAWRAGVRWPLAMLAWSAAIVVGVLICEAIGWPFLVAPMQHRLETLLDRRVVLGAGSERAQGVRIGLLGSVRVSAPSIEIGPPSWSPTPHTALARDARLKLGYLDLWRAWHGEPLHVADLEAASLDAFLERRADGRASWQFGKQKEEAPPGRKRRCRRSVGSPSATARALQRRGPAGRDRRAVRAQRRQPPRHGYRRARPGDGVVRARRCVGARAGGGRERCDQRNGIFIRAGGAAGSSKVAEGVRLAARRKRPSAEGGRPVQAVAGSDRSRHRPACLGFFADGAEAKAQPLSLRALIGRTQAQLRRHDPRSAPLHRIEGALQARRAVARLGRRRARHHAADDAAVRHPRHAGQGRRRLEGGSSRRRASARSRLDGAFTYDKRPKVPLLAGRLGGSRVLLADLGPTIGAPSPGSAKPRAPPRRAAASSRQESSTCRRCARWTPTSSSTSGCSIPAPSILEPLRNTRAHLLLADGVLTIADFEGTTAQGKLVRLPAARRPRQAGALDRRHAPARRRPRAVAAPQAQGRFAAVPHGKLDALVKVKGAGRSAAEILASLDGDLRMHMRERKVSHLVVEAAGSTSPRPSACSSRATTRCRSSANVADLDIVKGVARPKVFVVNTPDSTIWIDGTVSFQRREPRPSLRRLAEGLQPADAAHAGAGPRHAGQAAVSLELGKLAGKAGAAGLLALLSPLAAIVPFIDPGAQEGCRPGRQRMRRASATSGVIPAPVRIRSRCTCRRPRRRRRRGRRTPSPSAERRAPRAAFGSGFGARPRPGQAPGLRFWLRSGSSPFACDLPSSSARSMSSASRSSPGAASRAAGSTLPDSANSRLALS